METGISSGPMSQLAQKGFTHTHVAIWRLRGKNSRQVQIFSRQTKEAQSVDIHDVLNAQGFAMHYRAILNGSPFRHFPILHTHVKIVYLSVP